MERLTDGNNVIATKYGRTVGRPTCRRSLGGPVADDARRDEASDEFYLAKCSGGALTTQSMIEPGLRPAPPKDRNIHAASQRLSQNLALKPGNREHRDGTPNCKSPLLAGLLLISGAFSPSPGLSG